EQAGVAIVVGGLDEMCGDDGPIVVVRVLVATAVPVGSCVSVTLYETQRVLTDPPGAPIASEGERALRRVVPFVNHVVFVDGLPSEVVFGGQVEGDAAWGREPIDAKGRAVFDGRIEDARRRRVVGRLNQCLGVCRCVASRTCRITRRRVRRIVTGGH